MPPLLALTCCWTLTICTELKLELDEELEDDVIVNLSLK